MTVSEKQRLFTKLTGKLILWAYEHGYELTYGEAWRTQAQAKEYARTGKGIANSLHIDRLAVDFNLFVAGEYKTASEAYKPLGEYWESLHPDCAWGGRFGDGNHFSLAHNGRK
jgi:hypothetical protein